MAKSSSTRTRRRLKANETHRVNTTGGAVRISQPSSDRNKATTREKAAVVVDVVTPRAVEGFFGFLREHAVVGLAVGLVIGTQLKAIVDSLNSGFIDPLIGLFFTGGTLKTQELTVHFNNNVAQLKWGGVVYQIIDFIFVMAIIYALIKLFKLDKLDKKKE